MNRVTAMGPIAGFHLRRRRCATVAVVAVSLGAISLVPAAARADSIVYEKGGNIWLSSPDGARSVQVTASGGYSRPAQADDGTIIAVKDKLLQRLTRTGGILNLAGASDYTGPQTPSISPNGALVAYQFFATGPILTGFHVAFSRSDRPTPNYEITDTLGGYINPAFLDDGRVVIFEPDRTVDTQIWTPSGTVQDWFSEPDADLGGGEADRGLTRFAAVAGSATSIRIYRLNSPPPAAPELRYVVAGAAGTFFPAHLVARRVPLAWQEDDGIHVMPVDLDNCAGTSRLVIPGGQAPDWGPAGLPASPRPGGGGRHDPSAHHRHSGGHDRQDSPPARDPRSGVVQRGLHGDSHAAYRRSGEPHGREGDVRDRGEPARGDDDPSVPERPSPRCAPGEFTDSSSSWHRGTPRQPRPGGGSQGHARPAVS